jgi:hypothetical protein
VAAGLLVLGVFPFTVERWIDSGPAYPELRDAAANRLLARVAFRRQGCGNAEQDRLQNASDDLVNRYL